MNKKVRITFISDATVDYQHVQDIKYLGAFIVLCIRTPINTIVDKVYPNTQIKSVSILTQLGIDPDSNYNRKISTIFEAESNKEDIVCDNVLDMVEALGWDHATRGNIIKVCLNELPSVKKVKFKFID